MFGSFALSRLSVVSLSVALACTAGPARGQNETFLGAPMISARKFEATQQGQQAVVEHAGAGWLHSAQVLKLGGETGETYVAVELDGQVLYSTSFGLLAQPWREVDSLFMMANVRRAGDTYTLTIWHTPELAFRGHFAIRVEVQEPGVRTLYVSAVHSLPAD